LLLLWLERTCWFTIQQARKAVCELTALAPPPREWTDGTEIAIPIGNVRADEIVIVPPVEQIPVTGTVIAGPD
jgi:cation transport ATPase